MVELCENTLKTLQTKKYFKIEYDSMNLSAAQKRLQPTLQPVLKGARAVRYFELFHYTTGRYPPAVLEGSGAKTKPSPEKNVPSSSVGGVFLEIAEPSPLVRGLMRSSPFRAANRRIQLQSCENSADVRSESRTGCRGASKIARGPRLYEIH